MASQVLKSSYPRAYDPRPLSSPPEVKVNKLKFRKLATINFVIQLLLFFALFCYLFGSLYQQETRVHNLAILWVDYDGGIIGDAMRRAYQSVQSSGFPTLVEKPVSDFPTPSRLWEAVCNTDYWAAVYSSPRASERLGEAISGAVSSPYNASDVLSFIWNEARYPLIVDGLVAGKLGALSSAARVAYYSLNGTAALSAMPFGDETAMSAFTNPWILTSYNIQPTTHGTRAMYNTLVIVIILVQDFFYLAVINGLSAQFKIFTSILPNQIVLSRNAISAVFTMIGAMLLTCAIWAFRASWDVSGTQFALTWLILWLFAHANYLTLDIFTIWIPQHIVPLVLITWVILNVTAVILPFDLSSSFYRWAYATPACAAYQALTDVWSSGCNPRLSYALPVLFAYEVSGLLWTALGVFRRCHVAVLTEEDAQEVMHLHVEAVLKLEREHDRRLRRDASEKNVQTQIGEPHTDPPAEGYAAEIVPYQANEEADNGRRTRGGGANR